MKHNRKLRLAYGFTLGYVFSIAAINWSVTTIPPLDVAGALLPPGLLLAGGVFVLRDYSQREIGHWVLAATALGTALSFATASPEVATASACAFAISETVDWAVFTITRRKLADRIMISSALSVPVDTAAFYALIGILAPVSFALGVAVKMIASVGVYAWLRLREARS